MDAGELPEVVGCAEPVGHTEAFGPVLGGERAVCGPASRPGGASTVSITRGREVHLRHRGLPARQRRRAAGPIGERAGRLGGLAGRGVGAYCLDGQVYTAGAAVSWLSRWGVLDGPAELDGWAVRARRRGGRVRARAGRLGAPWWRPTPGPASGPRPSRDEPALIRATIEGVAAPVACRPGRWPSTSALRSPACGWTGA